MADPLDDGEFWLPPQFLTDDDVLLETEKKVQNSHGSKSNVALYEYPCGFGSYGGNSDLSSPVESVVGSTETESDEEDFMADLTRKMATSTLDKEYHETTISGFGYADSKGRCLSVSPQSTLCSCCQGPLHASSPPNGWDLLREAAGEVAKMRLQKHLRELRHGRNFSDYHNQGKVSPIPVPLKNPNASNIDLLYPHNTQSLSYQQMLFTQQLKQQQHKLQQRNSGVSGSQTKATGRYQMVQYPRVASIDNIDFVGTRNARPLGMELSPSVWPSLQQARDQGHQAGSGMRAVFLGAPSVKRGCAGTGVFLPRRVGSEPEPRRNPAGPTVLVPAKVVQALNMNLGSHPVLQPRFDGRVAPEAGDRAYKFGASGGPNAQHRRNMMRVAQPVMSGHEIPLPREWTY